MDRAGFWHVGFFRPAIPRCVVRTFKYLQTLFKTPDLENFALAYLSSKHVINLAEKGGRSESDKLDRRRSTELTLPPSSDARPLQFITWCGNGMVNVDLYSAIITKVSNALNTLVSGEKPGF